MSGHGPGQTDGPVAAAAAGDRDAIGVLWRVHRRWVAAVLLAHMPRDGDLEDLLQDVAMTVVAKVGELRSSDAFRPWLRAVAVNAARTAGRRKRVRSAMSSPGEGEPIGTADCESASVLQEGRRLLDLARDLPDGYREPLLLRCINGMSYRQIGLVTGLPETTVETRIARGRRMLRDLANSNCGAGRPAVGAGSTGPA